MSIFISINNFLKKFQGVDFLAIFFFRLYLFFIFYSEGTDFYNNIGELTKYYSTLGVLFPDIFSFLVIGIELGGAALLLVGLFVRWAVIPMILLMCFKIIVLWENGWSLENNGIELSVTYLSMLLLLFFSGGGRFLSLDYWVSQK
tara:strand:- start:1004 stop:1438 length:435 start_codon:yes stop_codon:yes gene_type:complete